MDNTPLKDSVAKLGSHIALSIRTIPRASFPRRLHHFSLHSPRFSHCFPSALHVAALHNTCEAPWEAPRLGRQKVRAPRGALGLIRGSSGQQLCVPLKYQRCETQMRMSQRSQGSPRILPREARCPHAAPAPAARGLCCRAGTKQTTAEVWLTTPGTTRSRQPSFVLGRAGGNGACCGRQALQAGPCPAMMCKARWLQAPRPPQAALQPCFPCSSCPMAPLPWPWVALVGSGSGVEARSLPWCVLPIAGGWIGARRGGSSHHVLLQPPEGRGGGTTTTDLMATLLCSTGVRPCKLMSQACELISDGC